MVSSIHFRCMLAAAALGVASVALAQAPARGARWLHRPLHAQLHPRGKHPPVQTSWFRSGEGHRARHDDDLAGFHSDGEHSLIAVRPRPALASTLD